MSTITMDHESWIGSTLIGSDDGKLGTIEAIYFDEQTGRPQWMAVKTGLFGTKHHFVPLAEAAPVDDAIRTPYDKSQVDDAPNIDADEDLRDDQVVELYRYYGLPYDAPQDADRDIVVLDERLTATAPGTQADDDMLIATGQPVPVRPAPGTQAEEDMRIATGQAEPYRAA